MDPAVKNALVMELNTAMLVLSGVRKDVARMITRCKEIGVSGPMLEAYLQYQEELRQVGLKVKHVQTCLRRIDLPGASQSYPSSVL